MDGTSTVKSKIMNEYIRKTIGNNIRKIRKSRNLNQDDLSKMVDLSRTSIVNIEQGIQQLTIDNLYKIASVLNCNPHDIIPNETKPKIRLKLVKETITNVIGVSL